MPVAARRRHGACVIEDAGPVARHSDTGAAVPAADPIGHGPASAGGRTDLESPSTARRRALAVDAESAAANSPISPRRARPAGYVDPAAGPGSRRCNHPTDEAFQVRKPLVGLSHKVIMSWLQGDGRSGGR